jgi:hypothetical protein
MYDIIHDIMMPTITFHALQPQILSLEQRADAIDHDHEPDRPIDFDDERDFADQGPLTDMDMEEDTDILALMLKYNSHPTIPYSFKDDWRIGHASANTQRDRGNGSIRKVWT